MKVRNTMRVCSMLLVLSLVCVWSVPARAQDKEHAVTSGQLRSDLQKAAENRQGNEAAVREMFATDAGKQALKSAGIEYQKVDQAITGGSFARGAKELCSRTNERPRLAHYHRDCCYFNCGDCRRSLSRDRSLKRGGPASPKTNHCYRSAIRGGVRSGRESRCGRLAGSPVRASRKRWVRVGRASDGIALLAG